LELKSVLGGKGVKNYPKSTNDIDGRLLYPSTLKALPGVNFINILCEQFLHEQIPKAQKESQVGSLFCAFGLCTQQKLHVKH
jgi:hypothetical protein